MRRPAKKPFVKRQEEEIHKIDGRINSPEVRVIFEGEEPRVMATSAAIALADEQELDLLEISPNATPPVCKIMDYKKFLYNQKRKQKEYVHFLME